MKLPLRNALKLIKKAYEKQSDEEVLRFYLIDYSKMNKETFLTFAQWKELAVPKKVEKVDIPKDLFIEKILAVGKK